MIKKVSSVVLLVSLLLSYSCATLLSDSDYAISIISVPTKAKIVITDKEGSEVFSGQTPATVELKSGNGYFAKAFYQVKFVKNGYETKTVPIHFTLDGWYFGNLFLATAIGMLIVDPITGAMYRPETQLINEALVEINSSSDVQSKQ